jgi:NAD(P)-dependent dehydrogenase (short-subunit alcohol dehydrogenase family)
MRKNVGGLMENFTGRIAVVTGGGTGMGRELVRQLAKEGCHVATCDVSASAMDETKLLALEDAPSGTRVTTFVADVADEGRLLAFRDAVASDHSTTSINLLFNNAGIAGGGSFIDDDRDSWERTFAIDWGGVYLGTRTFLPMLMEASEGHIVNTSSVNGIFASIGPSRPHTAYCAAKFAVRGFSEALITDLRVNAPHINVSVVMPGHVGTSIVINSGIVHGKEPDDLTEEDLFKIRRQLAQGGLPVDDVADEDLRKGVAMFGEAFRDLAPLSAAGAATIILDGVRKNQWRILVGDDAVVIDEMVRSTPDLAYEPEFWESLQAKGLFQGFGV